MGLLSNLAQMEELLLGRFFAGTMAMLMSATLHAASHGNIPFGVLRILVLSRILDRGSTTGDLSGIPGSTVATPGA